MDPAEEPHLPPSVRRRYVLDGEQLVVAIHQHPVVVAEPVATALAVLVLVVFVDSTVSGSAGVIVNALWWVWFVTLARALWMVYEWRHQWVIATDKRLMMTYGFIVRKVAMMPLGKVTDMSYHRSIAGRIFGWGTFVIESAGQQQALSQIDFVPSPDHNYRAMCAEIFHVEDHERVTPVDDDVQEAQWDSDDDNDVPRYDDGRFEAPVHVEPGSGLRVRRETETAPRRRPPRDGYDTADLPVVDSRVAHDADAKDLLSSWERFARRYDEVPEAGLEDGTSIYRSGDDPLS